MSVRPLAQLLHWEAVTSLGESAAETALLLRAGIGNVAPSQLIDAAGERVMLCAAPALPMTMPPTERMLTLAEHAIARLWQGMTLHESSEDQSSAVPATLLVALPERFAQNDRSFELTAAGQAFIAALRERLPAALAAADIEAFPFGRAAGALAMRRALDLVSRDRVVIWGGVDTLVDWSVIEALERQDRLLTLENVDGIRPGEGAAFVALGPPRAGPGGVSLLGLGLGREPHPVGADEPCLSDGWSQALASAVGPLRAASARCGSWWLDTLHETYATQEVQNIIGRFGDVIAPQTDMQTPLKELGDVGSAALPLLAALSAQAWQFGLAADHTAVLAAASDRGARGALLLAGMARASQESAL